MEKEIRYTLDKNVEVRENDNGGYVIEGVAALVNKDNDMGWYIERIEQGAFDERLNDDVRFLYNHDANMILARTKSGTGELFLDDSGNLNYRYVTPNRTYAKDLADAIRSGDIDQSSYAFTIDLEDWETREDGREVRTIKKYKRLYDVSPVTYPADPDTSVAKRSKEQIEQEKVEHTPYKETETWRDLRLSILSKF